MLPAYRTNRLFRETYGALKFVNEEVVDRGKRVVFVSNNIDTADMQAWKTQLSMNTVVDELSKLTQIKAESKRPVMIPTEDEVLKAFDHLEHVLNAACLGDEEDAMAAREVIELVTCGRIVLQQAGEAKAKHGWLRGVLKANVLNPVTKQLDAVAVTAEPREVFIDFRKPAPFEVLADRAKVLYDQGLLLNQIAAELGVRGNLCRKALDHGFTSRDLKRLLFQTCYERQMDPCRTFELLMEGPEQSLNLWKRTFLPAVTRRFGVSLSAAVFRFQEMQLPHGLPFIAAGQVPQLLSTAQRSVAAPPAR